MIVMLASFENTYTNQLNLANMSTTPIEGMPYVFNTIRPQYLRQLSGGDVVFEKEILQQFTSQVPEELEQLQQAYRSNNWIQLRSTAHNLKTTVSFLGLTEILANDLELLEKKTGPLTDVQDVNIPIDNILLVCKSAIADAQGYLESC